VDTNVFTAWLRGSRSPLAVQYTKHLVGKQLAVSPQTVAEARYGALKAGWGPRRLREVEQIPMPDLRARSLWRRWGLRTSRGRARARTAKRAAVASSLRGA
jgi:predicted nucleic acid-binding protein